MRIVPRPPAAPAPPTEPGEDKSIHFNPDVAKPGISRETVEAALGPPNATMTLETEQVVALYAFFPDGGKFINPGLGAEFFSHSASSRVSSAELEGIRQQLTFVRISYSLDGAVTSVAADKPLALPQS